MNLLDKMSILRIISYYLAIDLIKDAVRPIFDALLKIQILCRNEFILKINFVKSKHRVKTEISIKWQIQDVF